MTTTYQQLFCGTWNAERFVDLYDVELSEEAVVRIAQLALAGWKFCGADADSVELERTGGMIAGSINEPGDGSTAWDEFATVDRVSGDVSLRMNL